MVERPTEYPWPSAAPHTGGEDRARLLDLEWWRAAAMTRDWHDWLRDAARDVELEHCTYAGRPFGDVDLVTQMGPRFGRRWPRGRPNKKPAPSAMANDRQGSLIAD